MSECAVLDDIKQNIAEKLRVQSRRAIAQRTKYVENMALTII